MKETIHIPEGIRHLSEWPDFGAQLPKDCHFILNKALTGVGATQYFLTNSEFVILASPRNALLESKRKKHPNVWFYRDLSSDSVAADGDKPKANKKKATFSEIAKFNDALKDYLTKCAIHRTIPKIMVTYDSLGHVISALKSLSVHELDRWTLVIDEFQCIFCDAAYKGITELQFLGNCKMFKRAIYLSATPYLETYMNQMDEFKAIPYIELVWPPSMKEKVTIINVPQQGSVVSVVQGIIEKMRKGKTVKVGPREIDTPEAVFYLNKVSDILSIIKKCSLKPSEVNILCSKDNEKKLKKVGHQLGDYPKEGEYHKMFTFCTRTSFLGVDFYSTCAYTYIFADPAQKTLALDIFTDITQIIGRQRLDTNPYRNEAVLYVRENSVGKNTDDFCSYIDGKVKESETLEENFNNSTPEAQEALLKVYRRSAEIDHFSNNYLCVVDDMATGKPKLMFNDLVMLSEIRAWDIRKDGYRNLYVVIDQQKQSGMEGKIGTNSSNPDVLAFKADFESSHDTTKRIAAYAEFRQKHEELAGELDFLSSKYAEYWDALGYERLRMLGFQESKIKAVLAEPSPFDDKQEEVIRLVRKSITENKRYTSQDMKELLGGIYKKASYPHTAKATDISKYVSARTKQDSKTGKRSIIVSSIYQKEITFFPFVWRPNRPMGADIDRFLEIVRTGKYNIKKNDKESRLLTDVVAEIRGLADHEAQNKIKKDWLPAACINGTFKYKDDNGIDTYSSFLALDYDGFKTPQEMEEAKEALKAHQFVYAIFESPSGKGIKALVLHDSVSPVEHWNLYAQVLNACMLPQTDDSVSDLSRGQFFSYDPGLWKNPNPVPFHYTFDRSISRPDKSKKKKSIVARDKTGQRTEVALGEWTSQFLANLYHALLTDSAVLRRLSKHWTEKHPEYFEVGNRHRSMLIMSGTLCKAGIPRETTEEYLENMFPGIGKDEIQGIIDFSYENNAFGSDRRKYD